MEWEIVPSNRALWRYGLTAWFDVHFARAIHVCLLPYANNSLRLLHRAAPRSLAPLLFRRVSSELMLARTASKFGGSPKIMPCMAR